MLCMLCTQGLYKTSLLPFSRAFPFKKLIIWGTMMSPGISFQNCTRITCVVHNLMNENYQITVQFMSELILRVSSTKSKLHNFYAWIPKLNSFQDCIAHFKELPGLEIWSFKIEGFLRSVQTLWRGQRTIVILFCNELWWSFNSSFFSTNFACRNHAYKSVSCMYKPCL